MKFFVIILVLILAKLSSLYAGEMNACMRKAIENKVKLNKILTLCRDNIQSVDVYSNNYKAENIENTSDYISTNKTDEIIHELIEKGELKKASRLAERLEIEKTKRIKARAEAEALRSPQIIATNSTNNSSAENTQDSNIRSILTLGNNPIASIASGSKVLEITTPAAHGAIPGQYVTITNTDATIDGIAASEINKQHVISSVPSVTKFRISVLSAATAGSVSGGGSEVVATFLN